jgi:hypothetical protein
MLAARKPRDKIWSNAAFRISARVWARFRGLLGLSWEEFDKILAGMYVLAPVEVAALRAIIVVHRLDGFNVRDAQAGHRRDR